jgi:hypothetical protein
MVVEDEDELRRRLPEAMVTVELMVWVASL